MFAIRLARIPRSRANPHEARGAGLRQAPANRSLEERQRILDEDGVAEGASARKSAHPIDVAKECAANCVAYPRKRPSATPRPGGVPFDHRSGRARPVAGTKLIEW